MSQKISVLIPTWGREKEPMDTVRALLSQTRVPDEIIIVDQNDPPFKAMDEYFASLSTETSRGRVRHIKSDVKGVTFNMNIALKESQSEIVLFLDDDIIPEPDLVARHLTNYTDACDPDGTLGGVAGRVEQPSGDPAPETISEVGQYHFWSGAVVAHFNSLKRQDVLIAPGGNMSFKKQALLRAGGFDIGFDGNGYFFEPDICLRVVKVGYQIVFDPTASLKHLMAPSGGARVKDKAVHTYFFVKNGIRLYRRHSPILGLPLFLAKMAGYSAAKAAYNADPRILLKGLAAIGAGMSQELGLKNNAIKEDAE